MAIIGVLDSGVGGLSVLTEIHRLLPGHATLYVADQGNAPYGPRPRWEIEALVGEISENLLLKGAQIIVLACHAASAAGLHVLRGRFTNVPFVGIEPAVKPAAENTRSGVVGVLTTQATANGELYRSVLARFANDVQVITRIAPDLVTLVEDGAHDTAQGKDMIAAHVTPLLEAGADQIVLACTHFPFLVPQIAELAGTDVALVDPGPAVAKQTARLVATLPYAERQNAYFTTGDPARFKSALKQMAGIDAPVTALSLKMGRLNGG
jgi:glutamate racemase